MLIVFDLDDTLVDTSICLIAPLIERALKAMMQAGLVLEDPLSALAELRRLNATADSAREALALFAKDRGLSRYLLDVALEVLYPVTPPDLPLRPVAGAVALLQELSCAHRLALVTRGRPLIQMWKLEKASIDTALFSKILVTDEGSKKPLYEELMEIEGAAPAEVLVCGDRIDPDLKPAKMLGCCTVHIRWGRGACAPASHPDVDYSIDTLVELKAVMRAIGK